MNFSKRYIEKLSEKFGFQPLPIEKVLRLIFILREINKHPYLKNRLVLKGGTAINLFYLNLPRLSVDIDFDYVGSPIRETMLSERKIVEDSLMSIFTAQKYKFKLSPDEHAGRKFRLSFIDVYGNNANIEVDINYLMRVCILGPVLKNSFVIDKDIKYKFKTLKIEEILAGKIKALFERNTSRDLYDLYKFIKLKYNFNKNLLKKISILFCSTVYDDFRKYSLNDVNKIKQEEIKNNLYPILKLDDRPTKEEMIKVIKPLIRYILYFTRNEEIYLNSLMEGEYKPELLFRSKNLSKKLKLHPAPLWKIQNIKEFKKKIKK